MDFGGLVWSGGAAPFFFFCSGWLGEARAQAISSGPADRGGPLVRILGVGEQRSGGPASTRALNFFFFARLPLAGRIPACRSGPLERQSAARAMSRPLHLPL